MKTIGIVGGLGPEASLYYYRTLIDLAHEAQSPETPYPEIEMVIYNLNQNESAAKLFKAGRWADHAAKLLYAIERLYRAGADFAIIACNTAHTVFDEVKAKSPIPLLSIVEETCKAVERLGLVKVGLFGSPDTMRGYFYPDVFSKRNISVVVPKGEDQDYIGRKSREELALGVIRDETRQGFLEVAQRMIDEESIQGLILGCTEIPLLLGKEKFVIPFFDTSKIHVESAFRYSLLEA